MAARRLRRPWAQPAAFIIAVRISQSPVTMKRFATSQLQNRKCAHCGEEMPLKYSELDRKEAAAGYTVENTELVNAKCHQERQASKGYT
jgi:hypothetical protein